MEGRMLGLCENDKARFAAVQNRAEKLGVLDINFSGAALTKGLDSYERTLDIVEEHYDQLNKNTEKG